jgi:hypothetical protein
MQDDPDDDDDDHAEEQEQNSQEEFINSDEFSSSIPIDPNQSGPSMFTKRSKKLNSNLPLHRGLSLLGTLRKKNRTLLPFPCGGVENSKKFKNNKNARFQHAVTTKLLI